MVAITRYLAIFTFVVLCIPTTAKADTVYYDTMTGFESYPLTAVINNNGNGVEDSGEDRVFHIQFTPETTMYVSKIEFENFYQSTNANATTTGCSSSVLNCETEGWFTIYESSTSTYPLDSKLVYLEYLIFNVDAVYGDQSVQLSNYVYLKASTTYIFQITPHIGTPADSAGGTFSVFGRYVSGDATTTTNGALYPYDIDTQTYMSNIGYAGLKLSRGDISTYEAPVILSEPCTTSSYTKTGCSYGLASTTEDITVSGTSSLNMSIDSEAYFLTATWRSANGNVIDEQTTLVSTLTTAQEFTFTLYRDPAEMTSVISQIAVCQYFDDYEIMSGYSTLQTDTGSLCAYVNVGDDLTEEETTQVACQLGWCDPDDNVEAGAPPENTRPTDPLNITGLASTTVTWYQERFEDLKYGFPYGYLVYLYEAWSDYKDNVNNQGTTTDFIIGFDVANYFDSNTGSDPEIPHITTTWNITEAYEDGLAQYDTAGLVDLVDKFLYGIFGLFLVVRIASSAWQNFGQGIEMGSRRGIQSFRASAYDQAQRTRDMGSGLMQGRRKGYW